MALFNVIFCGGCFFSCSDLELKPVGTLEVKLVRAKDLTNKDIIGKSDPFAKLYVRPLRDRMKTSKVIVSSVLTSQLGSYILLRNIQSMCYLYYAFFIVILFCFRTIS